MTKAYSQTNDNGGRCESCNEPDSVFRRQSTVKVYLGGGLGYGTMWVCAPCKARNEKISALQAVLARIEERWR